MLKFFDYIFWRIYSFLKKHKLCKETEEGCTTGFVFLIVAIPLGVMCGFLMSIGLLPDVNLSTDKPRIFTLAITAFLMSPFLYRYLFKKSITKNDYEVFRTKWDKEPLPIRKRRKWLIIALFVLNCVIIPLILFMLP